MSPDQDVRTEISGRYRLRSEIGKGGMGTVWHAEDTLLQRAVAVKEIELPRAVGADEREAIRKRVLREARAAAALNHGNVVTVFDVIEEEGKAFIVMECIAGRTLDDIVKKDGPLDDARIASIAKDVLSALEVAHAAGIVHRDVKPANVMITDDGRTKLADFGIASVKDDPKITASGLILGSPSYMAPEQATHGTSGPESDLWGIGATLYFAQEGTPPFDGTGPIPTLTAVVGDEPRPMQRPGKLAPVIESLLTKDPNARPTAHDVRTQMSSLADAPAARTEVAATAMPTTIKLEEPEPTPAPTYVEEPTQPATKPDRKPWLWAAAIAGVVGLGILLAMFFANREEANVPQADSRGDRKEARAGAGNEEAATETETDTSDSTAVDSAVAEVPAGWNTYEDPQTGYTIGHPADWEVEVRDSQNTFFHGPDGEFLQVAWRSPPDEAGPVGAWEEYEPSFASRQGDYELITIEPYDFKGMDAGWWEMTYEGLHAVNLGFITPDGQYGMALFFNAPEGQWDEAQQLFEQFQASYQPPA